MVNVSKWRKSILWFWSERPHIDATNKTFTTKNKFVDLSKIEQVEITSRGRSQFWFSFGIGNEKLFEQMTFVRKTLSVKWQYGCVGCSCPNETFQADDGATLTPLLWRDRNRDGCSCQELLKASQGMPASCTFTPKMATGPSFLTTDFCCPHVATNGTRSWREMTTKSPGTHAVTCCASISLTMAWSRKKATKKIDIYIMELWWEAHYYSNIQPPTALWRCPVGT